MSNEISLQAGMKPDETGNFGLFTGESRNWFINMSSMVSDSYLSALLGGASVDRIANGATLEYMLVKEAVYTSIFGNDAATLATLAGCATQYNNSAADCFQLSETNTTMGVVSGNSTYNGVNGEIIMHGNYLPYGVYRLYYYLPDQGVYYLNNTSQQRIAFLPTAFSIQNQYPLYVDNINHQQPQEPGSSHGGNGLPIIMLMFVTIPVIQIGTKKIIRRYSR